ncbi:transposase [Bdellovibrionota bacterium FG-1]
MSFVKPEDWAWCMEEFQEIDFGDARLNSRFRKTAGLLSSAPSSPINKASGNWACAKGAYRMFDNDRIDSDTIIKEHRKKTLERDNVSQLR